MGGVLVQWGTSSYNNNNLTSVTFPTQFTQLFTVTVTVDENGGTGSGGNAPCKVHSTTTSGFNYAGQVGFNGDNTTVVHWVAIGR
jgi:hypothetical protein